MYKQPLSSFWWFANIRYFVYFLRELTGPVIAFYVIYFLVSWLFDVTLNFVGTELFNILTWITLVFAIIHTVTWLFVTGKLMQPSSSHVSSSLTFFICFLMIFIWLAVSCYILLPIFYVTV
jgi:fumarate reductase subunit C